MESISFSGESDAQCSRAYTEPGLGSLNPGRTQRLLISSIGQMVGPRTRGCLTALTENSAGGPGCSSTTGLLFELGPCQIANETNITYNKHSWNAHSNILFLDQPVNVGYSYSDDGSKIDRSAAAGEDVYAFFQLFFSRFPEYSKAPFHMAAESYGGTYAPNAAAIFHRKNKELSLAPVPGLSKINLASVILANGITDPYEQMASIPDWACEGPYAVYDDPQGPECQALRTKVPTCQRLVQSCYKFDSRWTCVPAYLYCWSQLLGPLQRLSIFILLFRC